MNLIRHASCCRYGNREDIVVATKCRMPTSKEMKNWTVPAFKCNSMGLSRMHIMHAVEDSLRNLQTDYIDLYQVGLKTTDKLRHENHEIICWYKIFLIESSKNWNTTMNKQWKKSSLSKIILIFHVISFNVRSMDLTLAPQLMNFSVQWMTWLDAARYVMQEHVILQDGNCRKLWREDAILDIVHLFLFR